MSLRTWSAAVLLAGSSAFATPQPRPAAAPIETPHLTVAPSSPVGTVPRGGRVLLRLDITLKPKMHVYAPAQKDYIPVSLQLDKSADYTAHPPVFPKAEKFFFEPLNETQLVYSKPFRITQTVTIARTPTGGGPPNGTLTLTGALRYQACDDAVCYPPRNVPVAWTVSIR